MKLTLKIAKVLVRLINGESVTNSTAKSQILEELIAENILFRKGKHKKHLELINEEGLQMYLANQLQINNLYDYIFALKNEESTRAEFVKISTDSKHSKERTFKGFLVNCYTTIKAELNEQEIIINPTKGSFIFIYDYETFKIPKGITVVGVENPRNFRHIQEQNYLFEDINPLFISRYPQNQHRDFIKWMKSIPNNYLHFGDFDIAGIGIYINEYKCHLSNKSSFFIPNNIEMDIKKNGNRKRFDNQKINFDIKNIEEPEIKELIQLIKSQRKGLDQEFYIRN